MSDRHTPLPWSVVDGEAVVSHSGVWVKPYETDSWEGDRKWPDKSEAEANAQFIVTAANYHYRLVELLDKALGCMLVGIDSFSIEDSEVYSEGSALVNKLLDTKKD
jgi:hypothetical protein